MRTRIARGLLFLFILLLPAFAAACSGPPPTNVPGFAVPYKGSVDATPPDPTRPYLCTTPSGETTWVKDASVCEAGNAQLTPPAASTAPSAHPSIAPSPTPPKASLPPTVAPTATRPAASTAPSAPPALPPTSTAIPNTFTYVPGGTTYALAVDNFPGGWTRIRTAANGKNPPWTFAVRITADSPLDDVAQWDSPTKLLLGAQDAPITIKVEIQRDLVNGPTECGCDPYSQANAGNSPLGLGWFIQGNGATAAVNGNGANAPASGAPPTTLVGRGVYQLSFPKDMNGVYVITLVIQPHGSVTINQGERWTDHDNWPLPK